MISKFPLKGNFKYSSILGDEKLLMASQYNISRVEVTRDIIFMFTTYSFSMWIAISSTMIILMIVLSTGRYLLEEKRGIGEPIWIVMMFMLDRAYLDERNNFLLSLSIFMSCFSFFLTQYMLNGMSTDMIVIKDPIVVKSFWICWPWRMSCLSS